MQSWADIASDSDDDSVGLHHPANAQVQPATAEPEPEEVVEEEVLEEEAPPPKEYDWPTDPPFTAYVGNLPYSIKDSSELSSCIEDLVNNRFQTRVTIVQSRLAMDRQENRPRGFGYVEVENVDELKTVLKLNDGKSLFKGRPLKFDVASPPSNQNNSRRSLHRSSSRGESSRSNISDVDGSSFRGGRYMNRRDNSSSSSLRRQSSVSSDTSETARQRPSLKLAPRSKPTADQKESGSSSNLFGSGRARDDAEWERRRSETKQDRRGSASSTGGGGGGSRGGGGSGRGSNNNNKGKGGGNKGRGGGGGGRGKGGNKDTQKKNQQPKEKAADAAPKAVLKPPPKVAEPPAKPETTKVQNKFSALNMDSDSD